MCQNQHLILPLDNIQKMRALCHIYHYTFLTGSFSQQCRSCSGKRDKNRIISIMFLISWLKRSRLGEILFLFTDFHVETFSSTNVNILSHWSRGRQSSTSPSRMKGVVAEQIPAQSWRDKNRFKQKLKKIHSPIFNCFNKKIFQFNYTSIILIKRLTYPLLHSQYSDR